ncbi:MAG: UDP-N-acetylmuramate--L-alanine ligase, partial [Acidobacteriota bacterium]
RKPKQYTNKMFFKPQPIHFTGIGGIGMSGLAEVLLEFGYRVTGSDLRTTPVTQRLVTLGAVIYEGHAAKNIDGANAIVVSSAVRPDNPEVVEARRRGIPVIPRGELLAELMRLKYGIAVGGSHGKTTTTSMVAQILMHAGLDPTVVVGGLSATMRGSNARVGKSPYLVVESDESDGSFLKLAPILAVVTNIDREHLDHYADLDTILKAFTEFVNKVPFYGAAVLCLDDQNVCRILPNINRRIITYGAHPDAHLRVTKSTASHLAGDFHLVRGTEDLGCFRIQVPGAHNILNATAAVAIALELEVPVDTIREGLAQFSGVDRRFQIKGTERGVTVVDDYGHHPTEIEATLAAARACEYQHVHVLFQPHRYTRTQALMEEFAGAFHDADTVQVLDIYAASESPIEGVTSEALVQRMQHHGQRGAHHASSMNAGVEAVTSAALSGDVIFTLGAGSVSQAGSSILETLRSQN